MPRQQHRRECRTFPVPSRLRPVRTARPRHPRSARAHHPVGVGSQRLNPAMSTLAPGRDDVAVHIAEFVAGYPSAATRAAYGSDLSLWLAPAGNVRRPRRPNESPRSALSRTELRTGWTPRRSGVATCTRWRVCWRSTGYVSVWPAVGTSTTLAGDRWHHTLTLVGKGDWFPCPPAAARIVGRLARRIMPIRVPRSGTTAPGTRWTGTPPTPSCRTSPEQPGANRHQRSATGHTPGPTTTSRLSPTACPDRQWRCRRR